MSTARTTEDLIAGPTTELLGDFFENSETTFCGREVSLCNCISSKTLHTATIVIGIVLLILGIVGLIGHCAPTTSAGIGSPLIQKLNAAVNFVSTRLGTDPLILISFPTAFGIALSVTGIVGIVQNSRSTA